MTALQHLPTTAALSPPGRVALVGAGGFGRFCIDAYHRAGDMEVVAVADPLPGALAQIHDPAVRRESDWRAIMHDPRIEVVHLATPPYLRSEVVFAALAAGKSVMCEKPLALSMREADDMIAAAQVAGMALGVNYVMRFQPAYQLLELLAHSNLMGSLRTISFQNFAQSLPANHWFWDRAKSGGIFVEHGVHFFDAYGRIAGLASRVAGVTPRKEAVDASVWYASGVHARFYHEFSFPSEVERTLGISFFERGYIEIEGWIPTRLSGSVMAPLSSIPAALREETGLQTREEDGVTHFQLDFPHRQERYEAGIVAGMKDLIRKHRDARHILTVPIEDARESLEVGIACQDAATMRQEWHLHA